MVLKEYGKWICFEEIGKGGGGVVCKAIRKDTIKKYVDSIRELTKGFRDKGEDEQNAVSLVKTICENLSGSCIVALKTSLKDSRETERIRREIESIEKLKHPNIVKLIDCDNDNGMGSGLHNSLVRLRLIKYLKFLFRQ